MENFNPLQKIQQLAQKAREEGTVHQSPADIFKHRQQQEQKKPVTVSLEEAEKIFGKDFLGPKAVEQVYGVPIFEDGVMPIPFSKEDLELAKKMGQQLVYQIESLKTGTDPFGSMEVDHLTLKSLRENFHHDSGLKPYFYEQDWYVEEDFYKNEKPRRGWKLVSKDIIPNSTSKNYLAQTEVIVTYVMDHMFSGGELPSEYKEAIDEFHAKHDLLVGIMEKDWKEAAKLLADLKITKLTRETPVEIMYRLILNEGVNKEKLLPSKYTWSSRRDSDGILVIVGCFDSRGASVVYGEPDDSNSDLGVSVSRMK